MTFQTPTVEWLPGLATLAAGLILGVMLLRHIQLSSRTRSRKVEATTRGELISRRDLLIQRLRELEDTSSKHTSEQLDAERATLEHETALVLRDIDRLQGDSGGGAPGSMGLAAILPSQKPWAQFAWGAGSMLVIVGLVVLASTATTTRTESGVMTGNLPGEEKVEPSLAQLQAAVAKDPDDLAARLELARAHLYREDMKGLFEETKYVLEREPGNPRALAYQAFVALSIGETESALTMLNQALQTDPDLLEARIHLSLVYMRQGDREKAFEALAEAKRRHPDQAAMLDSLRAEMERSGGGTPPQDSAAVGGVIDLAEGQQFNWQSPPIIFVAVRAAGVTEGPPVAVKRLTGTSFPLSFTLTAADSMMGQALPARLRIEARVDTDGNPITRDPADPSAVADSVELGTMGLRLVLDR